MALWAGHAHWQQALLICGWLLLLMCELLNSTMEAVVDHISCEHHELSGRAKGFGSAAVFIVMIINLLMWVPTLLDPTSARLNTSNSWLENI